MDQTTLDAWLGIAGNPRMAMETATSTANGESEAAPPPRPQILEDPSWNEQQREFLRQPLTSGKLLGIPGGGKTRVLLGRILHLLETEQIPRKGGFLVLTFSRAACDDFLRKGQELRPEEAIFHTKNVRTVHSVAGSIVQRLAGRTSSLETVVYRAARECETQGGETLRARIASLRRVQTIVVDEAQDLSAVQYDFICALGRALGVGVVLVGDPNQNIYQFQGGSDRYLREHPGFQVALVRNYRSTEAIVRLVDRARPHRFGPMEAAPGSRIGSFPRLISGDAREIANDLVHRIRLLVNGAETVAVLGPVKRSKPTATGQLLSLGLQWAAQVLREAGIPVAIHYAEDSQEGGGEGSRDRGGGGSEPGRVHFLTAHASKGLEFDHVFVLNFHHATMSRLPKSQADEETFRYLWFVALSRARRSMCVYRLADRVAWPGLFRDGYLANFEIIGPEPAPPTKPISDGGDIMERSWTDVLRDRTILDEAALAGLEDAWDLRLIEEDPAEGGLCPPDELPMGSELATLYGMWAEETFYHAYRGEAPPCLHLVQTMIRGSVQVPRRLAPLISEFRRRMGLQTVDPIDLEHLERRRLALQGAGFQDLLTFFDEARARRPEQTSLVLVSENPVQWFDTDEMEALLKMWEEKIEQPGGLSIADIWRMCLFRWQYANEARWRWRENYETVWEALREHDVRIRAWARALPDGYRFQVAASLPHLPVHGIADAASDATRTVLELKFSGSEPQMAHALQAAGYAEMLYGKSGANILVWNLRTGARARVHATRCPQARWCVYRRLSDAVGAPLTDTCWLYDLETTGLDPHSCGITEVHMQELTSGIVPVSTLVHQSHLSPEVQRVTGITPALLAHAPSQSHVLARLEDVLRHCRAPLLCAHNGSRYDHAILRRLFSPGFPTETLSWTDSLVLLPMLAALPKHAKTCLTAIYESVLGVPPPETAHRAAADVRMMEAIFDHLRISSRSLRRLVFGGDLPYT